MRLQWKFFLGCVSEQIAPINRNDKGVNLNRFISVNNISTVILLTGMIKVRISTDSILKKKKNKGLN